MPADIFPWKFYEIFAFYSNTLNGHSVYKLYARYFNHRKKIINKSSSSSGQSEKWIMHWEYKNNYNYKTEAHIILPGFIKALN